MKALLHSGIILLSSLIISCNNNKTAADTNTSSNDSLRGKELTENNIYIDMASVDLPRYAVTVKEKYWDPGKPMTHRDSSYYFDATMIYILDKRAKKLDSAKLDMNWGDAHTDLEIQDVSSDLRFNNSLLLHLTWTGDSDMPTSLFVERTKDTIRNLFGMTFLQSIRRKDSKTLEGFVGDRDEVVYSMQYDYPFIISTKNYDVQIIKPERQSIGSISEALEDIPVTRIKNRRDSIPFTIPKGTRFIVDSINRPANSVRLIVEDSIIISADINKLDDRIVVNTAG